jgi:hypothetical protein
MANPLDREITKVLRKGRTPDTWRRPVRHGTGGNRPGQESGGQPQPMEQSTPVGQASTPPVGPPSAPPMGRGPHRPGRR